jgi:hypothetical protein
VEDLAPEAGHVIVDDRYPDQPGVEHLEPILVLKHVRQAFDAHKRQSLGLQSLVEGQQALVIGRGRPNVNRAA